MTVSLIVNLSACLQLMLASCAHVYSTAACNIARCNASAWAGCTLLASLYS